MINDDSKIDFQFEINNVNTSDSIEIEQLNSQFKNDIKDIGKINNVDNIANVDIN